MVDCAFRSTSFILKNVCEWSAEFASIKSAPSIYTINNVFGETPARRSQRGELCNSFSCSFLHGVYLIRQSVSDFSGNRRPCSVYCHGPASSDDYDSVHHLQAAGSRPAAQSVRGSLFSLRLPTEITLAAAPAPSAVRREQPQLWRTETRIWAMRCCSKTRTAASLEAWSR